MLTLNPHYRSFFLQQLKKNTENCNYLKLTEQLTRGLQAFVDASITQPL